MGADKNFHFMKGNEAAAEAGIRAGCQGYFFYPLTPSSEIGEYMSRHLDDNGGVFVQAESEISAINMVMGAASSGARSMTGTSGVGFSLMTECISYMAGAEIPSVVVNVMRGGPGLGTLEPTQADYNQATKGPGHSGALVPVFAPSDTQEIVDQVIEAFDISEKYRTPVIVLYDAYTGQVMESVDFPPRKEKNTVYDWEFADEPHEQRVVRSGLGPAIFDHWKHLYAKYDLMKAELQRYEDYMTDDADIVLVAFGIVGRICRTAVDKAREAGLKVGLIRPQMINPFPTTAFDKFKGKNTKFLTIEMSYGQMIDDVTLAVGSSENSFFYRNEYGSTPKMSEVMGAINKLAKEGKI